jgi:hypothetical protein
MHSYPGSGLGRSFREIKRFRISAVVKVRHGDLDN